MKKKIILSLAKRIPLCLSRRGEPTYFKEKLSNALYSRSNTVSDLDGAIITERKIHTIRGNYARWKHNIDKIAGGGFYLSVRQWSARPYNSPQEEIFQLHSENMGCQRITMSYDPDTNEVKAVIDGKYMADSRALRKNDGMTLDDFKEWFFGKEPTEKKLFTGIIIHFTPYRYGSDTDK